MKPKEIKLCVGALDMNWKYVADEFVSIMDGAFEDTSVLPNEFELATVLAFGQLALHYGITLKQISGKELPLYVPDSMPALAARHGITFGNPHNFFQHGE